MIEKTDWFETNYYGRANLDSGVSFHTAYYPESDIRLVVCSNGSLGAFKVMDGIEEELKLIESL